jgi:methylenetetrahydrofolate--tRNA-(uracil-5-)-methyltransferase
VAAINLYRELNELESIDWDNKTVSGALCCYISSPNADFQPMNANYGILAPVASVDKRKKDLKKKMMGERALQEIQKIAERINNNE